MWTLASPHRLEQVVNKSRFLALVSRAEDRAAALAFVEANRVPTATHNCFAFRGGADYKFSDDGEPGGTAGQPILRAIDGQGLDQVVALVVRWFGGIKLGSGGLVRAYGGVAAECLRTAPRIEMKPMTTLEIEILFEHVATLYRLLDGAGARRIDERYTDTGLALVAELLDESRAPFEARLRDATRGRARVSQRSSLPDALKPNR